MLSKIVRLTKLFTQSLKRPSHFKILFLKVAKKFKRQNQSQDNLEWLNRNASEIDTFCRNISPDIWKESLLFTKEFEEACSEKLSALDNKLGGAGALHLLYFLTDDY